MKSEGDVGAASAKRMDAASTMCDGSKTLRGVTRAGVWTSDGRATKAWLVEESTEIKRKENLAILEEERMYTGYNVNDDVMVVVVACSGFSRLTSSFSDGSLILFHQIFDARWPKVHRVSH